MGIFPQTRSQNGRGKASDIVLENAAKELMLRNHRLRRWLWLVILGTAVVMVPQAATQITKRGCAGGNE
jgi:hypothetical protein